MACGLSETQKLVLDLLIKRKGFWITAKEIVRVIGLGGSEYSTLLASYKVRATVLLLIKRHKNGTLPFHIVSCEYGYKIAETLTDSVKDATLTISQSSGRLRNHSVAIDKSFKLGGKKFINGVIESKPIFNNIINNM